MSSGTDRAVPDGAARFGTAPPRKTLEEPLVSVLVPVYNEEKTLETMLARLRAAPFRKEILLVDDGSSDGTPAVLDRLEGEPGIVVLRHPANRGKGAAIRTAIAHARGEYAVVQDADLEYDPQDLVAIVRILREGKAEVVYGSRYLGGRNRIPWTRFRTGVHLLNVLASVLYGQRITDEATCYKAFRTSLLRALDLRCERFEFCPEVTAKVRKRGIRILEIPISFHHRTVAEGKKIRSRDGWEAIWVLVRERFRR